MKKMKLWPYLIAGFAIILVLVFITSKADTKADPSTYSQGFLEMMENKFDFGTISMKDGLVTHQFEIKNEGSETLKIKKVYTSCMCTNAYLIDGAGQRYGKFGMPGHGVSAKTDVEIQPGQSTLVEAVFDPAAHGPSGVGLAMRSIYLETNSITSPKLELSFQAMVTQ